MTIKAVEQLFFALAFMLFVPWALTGLIWILSGCVVKWYYGDA